MMLSPKSDRVLLEAITDPGFTPPREWVSALVTLVETAEDETAKHLHRALMHHRDAAFSEVQARLGGAQPPGRARLARLFGKLASAAKDGPAGEALLPFLGDSDPKTRRYIAAALGRVGGPRAEDALVAALACEAGLAERRAMVEALGKVGGSKALTGLRGYQSHDPELSRLCAKAVLMLERSLSRGAGTERFELNADRAPPAPLAIAYHCRRGLEKILASELGAPARIAGPGLVLSSLTGPLAEIFRARTMLKVGFPLAPHQGELVAAVTQALTSQAARDVFATWSPAVVRYRLAFERGHKRSAVWRIAQDIAKREPSLLNDPTASSWEIFVREARDGIRLELCPRALTDPRFVYRKADVPAASHPTIAAALVRAAGVRDDDIVWDPFVGSGCELIERALAGPYRHLEGSDLDPAALAATRANLAAASFAAVTLTQANALLHRVPGVSLILTNPPLGRRVHGHADIGELLEPFMAHAASQLQSGGRLVWMSPLPDLTVQWARRAGLVPLMRENVDMGGFDAQLQVLQKGAI